MKSLRKRPALTEGGIVRQGRLPEYGDEPDVRVSGRPAFLEGVDLHAARSGLVVWVRFTDTGVCVRHGVREVEPLTPHARRTLRAAARFVRAAYELECRLGMASEEPQAVVHRGIAVK